MRRAPLLFATACSALLLGSLLVGCGGQPQDLSKQVQEAKNKSTFPIKEGQETRSTPEFVAAHAESAHERANYLRELGHDSKFDPKQHVEMLKKYESDPDSDVATAAKELLTKVQ
jgi:hypothetical protein